MRLFGGSVETGNETIQVAVLRLGAEIVPVAVSRLRALRPFGWQF